MKQKSDSVGSYYPTERPSLILASLRKSTTGVEATRQFWGCRDYVPGLDSVESYRAQPDYEDRHTEVDFAGSYNPYMYYYEGYSDCGVRGEYSDISLQLDLGSVYVEDPPVEVKEVLYGDSLTDCDVQSVVSGNDKPPASMIPQKALLRMYCLGTSKPAHVKYLKATLFKEETPFTRAHSLRTRVPVPNPNWVTPPVSVAIPQATQYDPVPSVRDAAHPDPGPVPGIVDSASSVPVSGIMDVTSSVPVPGIVDATHPVTRSVPVAAPPDPPPPLMAAAASPDLPPLITAALLLDPSDLPPLIVTATTLDPSLPVPVVKETSPQVLVPVQSPCLMPGLTP
ncbi:hypothetical protein P4O66_003760 [Electrophorus voltai]|uniref:Uncharacterized protein n=1 Tax=Electrophorus voltai TaxID=2609070 RepID=A0AAD9E4F5_9TELE|nr:hypothetical protein P4O66_003760 [Electrophorus voltai]